MSAQTQTYPVRVEDVAFANTRNTETAISARPAINPRLGAIRARRALPCTVLLFTGVFTANSRTTIGHSASVSPITA
jgi:hypothetical protein